MAAPYLIIIAAELNQIQVNANIDETDVGRMRPGQTVTFGVDAYPTETFRGNVKQVRLNPTTVQNVVTYSTVIDVPNPELKLKPGMTANVTIEIARRENVLRVPSAAVRFRPTADIFAALHQPVPPEMERGFGRGNRGGQNAGGRPGAPGTPAGGPGQPGAPAGAAPGATPAGQGPAPTSGQPQGPSAGSGQSSRQRPQGANTEAQGQQARAAQGQGDGQGQGGGQVQQGGGQVQQGGGQGQGGGRGFGG